MAKPKVAISGFGRIGRLMVRSLFQYDQEGLFDLVAVNGMGSPESMRYLLNYDSVHRRFPGTVEVQGDKLIVNGKTIQLVSDRNAANLPWKDLGIDIVVDSTGHFTDREKAKIHLENGVKKVIITAPCKNEDVTIVMGVNEEDYDPANHRIISSASCTTNCLAPVVKILQNEYGIEKGLMTTIHAYTNDQCTLDHDHKKVGRGRASALSIIPTTTGAAKAVFKVVPGLEGKLRGFALRVPTPDVSVVDLSVQLARKATANEINATVKKWAEGPMKGILAYEPEELVSMDFVGDKHSSIFAPNQTLVVDDMVKVLAWYDNEWGYSCRIIDMLNYMIRRGL